MVIIFRHQLPLRKAQVSACSVVYCMCLLGANKSTKTQRGVYPHLVNRDVEHSSRNRLTIDIVFSIERVVSMFFECSRELFVVHRTAFQETVPKQQSSAHWLHYRDLREHGHTFVLP